MGLGSFVKKAVKSVTKSVTGDGLLSFGSSLLAGGLSYLGTQSANAANAASSREMMEFQERMRATQYQTAVQDMVKAGLNPMLAYQHGGAGNLSGAQSAAAQSALGTAVSSSLEAKQAFGQLKNLEEQNKKLQQDIEASKSSVAATNRQLDINDRKVNQDYSISRDQLELSKLQTTSAVAAAQANTAKTYQDIANSKVLTAGQLGLLAAQARQANANSAISEADYTRAKIDAEVRSDRRSSWLRRIGTAVGDIVPLRGLFSFGGR